MHIKKLEAGCICLHGNYLLTYNYIKNNIYIYDRLNRLGIPSISTLVFFLFNPGFKMMLFEHPSDLIGSSYTADKMQ